MSTESLVLDENLKVLNFGTIIDNSRFHSPSCIFPVGYTSVRTYWDARDPERRIKYTCSIIAKHSKNSNNCNNFSNSNNSNSSNSSSNNSNNNSNHSKNKPNDRNDSNASSGPEAPIFRVRCDGRDANEPGECWQGRSASHAWHQVLRSIRKSADAKAAREAAQKEEQKHENDANEDEASIDGDFSQLTHLHHVLHLTGLQAFGLKNETVRRKLELKASQDGILNNFVVRGYQALDAQNEENEENASNGLGHKMQRINLATQTFMKVNGTGLRVTNFTLKQLEMQGLQDSRQTKKKRKHNGKNSARKQLLQGSKKMSEITEMSEKNGKNRKNGANGASATNGLNGISAISAINGRNGGNGRNGVNELDPEDTQWRKKCKAILKQLKLRKDYVKVFGRPVDEVRDVAPGYYKKIVQPMDLQKIEQKLACTDDTEDRYDGWFQVHEDLLLISRNAQIYNLKGHWIHKLAVRFAQEVGCKFAAFFQNSPRTSQRLKDMKRKRDSLPSVQNDGLACPECGKDLEHMVGFHRGCVCHEDEEYPLCAKCEKRINDLSMRYYHCVAGCQAQKSHSYFVCSDCVQEHCHRNQSNEFESAWLWMNSKAPKEYKLVEILQDSECLTFNLLDDTSYNETIYKKKESTEKVLIPLGSAMLDKHMTPTHIRISFDSIEKNSNNSSKNSSNSSTSSTSSKSSKSSRNSDGDDINYANGKVEIIDNEAFRKEFVAKQLRHHKICFESKNRKNVGFTLKKLAPVCCGEGMIYMRMDMFPSLVNEESNNFICDALKQCRKDSFCKEFIVHQNFYFHCKKCGKDYCALCCCLFATNSMARTIKGRLQNVNKIEKEAIENETCAFNLLFAKRNENRGNKFIEIDTKIDVKMLKQEGDKIGKTDNAKNGMNGMNAADSVPNSTDEKYEMNCDDNVKNEGMKRNDNDTNDKTNEKNDKKEIEESEDDDCADETQQSQQMKQTKEKNEDKEKVDNNNNDNNNSMQELEEDEDIDMDDCDASAMNELNDINTNANESVNEKENENESKLNVNEKERRGERLTGHKRVRNDDRSDDNEDGDDSNESNDMNDMNGDDDVVASGPPSKRRRLNESRADTTERTGGTGGVGGVGGQVAQAVQAVQAAAKAVEEKEVASERNCVECPRCSLMSAQFEEMRSEMNDLKKRVAFLEKENTNKN